jgi:hypothetical protein
MKDGTIITEPGWNFSVLVDGDDLVVKNVRATAFGGYDDAGDNGETASGMMTKHTPEPFGCALPILPNTNATSGSPFPLLPWGTVVYVECGDVSFYCPVIDNGPAKSTGNGIDLCVRCAKLIDPKATANNFEAVVSYRVIKGATFLPTDL